MQASLAHEKEIGRLREPESFGEYCLFAIHLCTDSILIAVLQAVCLYIAKSTVGTVVHGMNHINDITVYITDYSIHITVQ